MADLGLDVNVVGEALNNQGFEATEPVVKQSGLGLNSFGFVWDSNWSLADASVTTTWTSADASVSTTWTTADLPPFL